MGMNVVPLKELSPDEPKVVTLDLLKNMDPNDVQNEKSRGQLVVELTYKPFKEEDIPKEFDESGTVEKAPEGTPASGGMLVVIVHEAQDVEGKHHTNPYVRILFRGEEKKTKVSWITRFCPILCFLSCFKVPSHIIPLIFSKITRQGKAINLSVDNKITRKYYIKKNQKKGRKKRK